MEPRPSSGSELDPEPQHQSEPDMGSRSTDAMASRPSHAPSRNAESWSGPESSVPSALPPSPNEESQPEVDASETTAEAPWLAGETDAQTFESINVTQETRMRIDSREESGQASSLEVANRVALSAGPDDQSEREDGAPRGTQPAEMTSRAVGNEGGRHSARFQAHLQRKALMTTKQPEIQLRRHATIHVVGDGLERSDTLDMKVQRALAHLDSPGFYGSPGLRSAPLQEVDLVGGSGRRGEEVANGGGGKGGEQGQKRELMGKLETALSWTLGGFSHWLHRLEEAKNNKFPTGGAAEGQLAEPARPRRHSTEQGRTSRPLEGMQETSAGPRPTSWRPAPTNHGASIEPDGEPSAWLDSYPKSASEPLLALNQGKNRQGEEQARERGVVGGWEKELASRKAEPWGFLEGKGAEKSKERKAFKYDPVAAALQRKAARESAKVENLDTAMAGQAVSKEESKRDQCACGLWPFWCFNCRGN